jgi:hypothetical protein
MDFSPGEIARLARVVWQAEGCPAGEETRYRREVEVQLRAMRRALEPKTARPFAAHTMRPIPSKSRNSMPTSPAPAAPLDHDTIAQRAYLIWQREGQPIGQDVAIWLRAEAELRNAPPMTLAAPNG